MEVVGIVSVGGVTKDNKGCWNRDSRDVWSFDFGVSSSSWGSKGSRGEKQLT